MRVGDAVSFTLPCTNCVTHKGSRLVTSPRCKHKRRRIVGLVYRWSGREDEYPTIVDTAHNIHTTIYAGTDSMTILPPEAAAPIREEIAGFLASKEGKLLLSSARFAWSDRRRQAAQLVADGMLSDEQIRDECNVAPRTLSGWREHPEFTAGVERLRAGASSPKADEMAPSSGRGYPDKADIPLRMARRGGSDWTHGLEQYLVDGGVTRWCLARLREEHRSWWDALVWHQYYGMSLRDYAAMRGITDANAWARHSRAMRAMPELVLRYHATKKHAATHAA